MKNSVRKRLQPTFRICRLRYPAEETALFPSLFKNIAKCCWIRVGGAYYHITYTVFPPGVQLPPFNGSLDKELAIALAEVDRVLQQRGAYSFIKSEGTLGKSVMVSVPAGGKAVLFDKQGAGAISMIRVRTDLGRKNEEKQRILARQLVISMKWDNEAAPSVWVPLGDFFWQHARGQAVSFSSSWNE
ncbi:hypothetical protein D3C81_1707350 [compost metagenome]